MNRTGFHKIARRMGRRGQAGQSLVILAIAFIALVAFVGIVTDVSLLFVRFSTLRRAVDSAAVAAATQMRRVEDTNPSLDIDTGDSTGYANMNLAARQFLELYGLSPLNVLVETCQAPFATWDETDGWDNPVEVVQDGNVVVDANNQITRRNELCTSGRKLVRVTATITSPTVFLRLLGMEDITLTTDAISETAVLDVVIALDVSESMVEDTYYDDWEEALGDEVARFLPGRFPRDNGQQMAAFWRGEDAGTGDVLTFGDNPFLGVLNMSHTELEAFVNANPSVTIDLEDYDLKTQAYYPDEGFISDSDPRVTRVRADCRPRFWPYAHNIIFGDQNTIEILNEFRTELWGGGVNALERDYFNVPSGTTLDPTLASAEPYYRWVGFAPTFDFYGCCNDPNGDGSFADLACQPFKDARDASGRFLSRIDFPRGDGVSFVTFSRGAYIVRPSGPGTDPWIRRGTVIDGCVDAGLDASQAEDCARLVLEGAIGVRAEESFYADDPGSYTTGDNYWEWDAFVTGADEVTGTLDTEPLRYPGAGVPWNDSQMGSLTFFPVRNNCPFDMAATLGPFSPYTDTDPILYTMQLPSWLETMYAGNKYSIARFSYDYRGSCRDGNLAGALQATGNAFSEIPQIRREGAVWVMVLLGDGAAGASNPIQRNGADQIMSNPYQFNPSGSRTYVRNPPSDTNSRYGAFGLCPFGTSGSPGELVLNNTFPYCSDTDPNSRHSCATTDPSEIDPPNNPNYVDLGSDNAPGCESAYDVDDYARDWADYVGGVTAQNVQSTQLPIIFTIGFGLRYENQYYFDNSGARIQCTDDADDDCMKAANPDDFLGEELLRYIADVGDNFEIDDDYWQRQLALIGVFSNPDALAAEEQLQFYGQQGPCEDTSSTPTTHVPWPRETSCGNYFYAPGQSELEEVFGEIASRLFTRLAQ